MGLIIPTTLVKDAWNNVVNIKPRPNMNKTTPKVIKAPKIAIVPFVAFFPLFAWLDKNIKNAGYNGNTQTAVKGVASPKRKGVIISIVAIVRHLRFLHVQLPFI